YTPGMRQLLQKLRLPNLDSSCSNDRRRAGEIFQRADTEPRLMVLTHAPSKSTATSDSAKCTSPAGEFRNGCTRIVLHRIPISRRTVPVMAASVSASPAFAEVYQTRSFVVRQVVSELAPTGVLRAGINMSNFLLVTGKSDAGDPQGVAPDVAAEI